MPLGLRPASKIVRTDPRAIASLVDKYTKPRVTRTPSIFPIPPLQWGKKIAGESRAKNRRSWAVHKVRKDMPIKLLGGMLALDERRRLPSLQKVQMRASDIKRFDRFGGVEGTLAATDGLKLTRWGRHLRAQLFNELHRLPHRRFVVEHPELHHLEYDVKHPRSTAPPVPQIEAPRATSSSSTAVAAFVPPTSPTKYKSTHRGAFMDRPDTDDQAADMEQVVWDYKYLHRPELQRADARQASIDSTVYDLAGKGMPSWLTRNTLRSSTAVGPRVPARGERRVAARGKARVATRGRTRLAMAQ